MSRVLSTDIAQQSIQQMRQIINGGLADELGRLKNEGNTLSQPDNWDGPLAAQFRETWQQTARQLDQTQQQLEELRNQIEMINREIMSAGGAGA